MNSAAFPVPQRERIDSLDLLRGFALLGILMMNIQTFAMPFAAYFNPTAYGDLTGANYWAWFLTHVLFDQKFMTIFSLLFGAGIVLFTQRVEAGGASATAMHYRRTLWLLLIGLIHAYLLWVGDILVLYALCALAVFWFRKRSPRMLLAVGLIFLTLGSAISLAGGFALPQMPAAEREEMRLSDWQPPAEKIQEELAAYRGAWRAQLSHRVPLVFEFQTFVILVWGFWRAGGLMLVGMALFKWGVLRGDCSPAFYRGVAAAGAGLGWPLILYGVHRNEAAGWDFNFSFFFGVQFNYWGSLLVSGAYIAVLLLIHKSGALGWLTRRLRAVGQMAFTNYLMQTLLCITFFYGPGFGLFGSVARAGQVLTVLGVWVAQLVWSPYWLARFRYGPFEWLWRSLTYWRWQPMQRSLSDTGQAASTIS